MRKLILAAFLLIIALLVLPYFLGLIAQNQLQGFVRYASRNNAVDLKVIEYQRGWFSSHVKLKVSAHDPKVTNLLYALQSHLSEQPQITQVIEGTLNARVYHGPILLDTHKRGDFSVKLGRAIMLFDITPKANMPWLLKLIGDQALFSASVQVHLDGSLSFSYHSAEIATQSTHPDYASVKWPGAWGTLWFSRNFKQRRFDFTLGKLWLSGQGLTFTLATSNLSGSQKQTRTDFWLGNTELIVPRAQVQKNGQTLWQMDGLITHMASEPQNKTQVALGLQLALDRLQSYEQTYGPATVKFKASKLNLDALQSLLAQLQVFNQLRAQADNNHQPQPTPAALLPMLIQLIHEGVEVALDPFEIRVPEGQVSASVELRLPKLQGWRLLTGNVLNTLYAKIHLRMPQTTFMQAYAGQMRRNLLYRRRVERGLASGLASQPQHAEHVQQQLQYANQNSEQLAQAANTAAEQVVQTMLAKQYLVAIENDYQLTLLLQQGQLSVNGKPLLSPGQLLQLSLPLLSKQLTQP